MNAVPSAFAELVDDTLSDPEAALGERWMALTAAAAVVAHLAGRAPGEAVPAAELAARLRSTDSARHACVARGIQDLVAVMRTGISALLALTASKSDPKPAATALWSEYRAAQDAVLSLLGTAAVQPWCSVPVLTVFRVCSRRGHGRFAYLNACCTH